MKNNSDVGTSDCSVIDDASGAVVGRATSQNTAAGGSNVECHDYLADGKIIRFTNSRGIYAKDARLGATNDRSLPCGDGAFADDVKSCVALDTAPQAYGGAERAAAAIPFDVNLCAVGRLDCKKLVTIPRGLNRIGPGQHVLRLWDAKYCSDDRVLVLVAGVLRLFEAPSGKLLADAPAPDAVSIVKCEGGLAQTSRAKSNEALSFIVDRSSVRPSK